MPTPESTPAALNIYRNGQAMQIMMEMERAFQRRHDVMSVMNVRPGKADEVRKLWRDFEDIWLDQMVPIVEQIKDHLRHVLPES